MLKLRPTAWALALCLSLAACSNGGGLDEPPTTLPSSPSTGEETAGTSAISLMPESEVASSRASSPLYTFHNSFAIRASKINSDGIAETVMATSSGAPYRVNYLTGLGRWSYEIENTQFLKYWDLSATSYSFTGFAPYSPDNTIDAGGAITFRNMEGLNDSYTDWLACNYTRSNPAEGPVADVDELAPGVAITQPLQLTDVVPLVFHHVMSQVQFRLYSDDGDIPDVTNVEIRLIDNAEICSKAHYNTRDGITTTLASTADIFVGAPLESTKEGASTFDNALTLCKIPQIPQLVPEACRVKVDLTLGAETISATLNLHDATAQWLPDKVYIYYLRLSLVTNNIILVKVDVAPWLYGGETKVLDQHDF